MNSPLENGHDELRFAEYVLGVLDADARAAVEKEVRESSSAASALLLWQHHLLPLSDDIAPAEPPAYVWARILHALNLSSPTKVTGAQPQRTSLWNSLALWRWLGAATSVVAAACLVIVFSNKPAPTTAPVAVAPATAPPTVSAGYMVASIQQDNGVAGWTATMDLAHAQMVVVPATPTAVASDRSTELWLIAPGEKPKALGVIGRDKSTTMKLRPDLLALLSAKAVLAVSVEPLGGSPTGQPTGAVIAKGAISGA